MSDRLDIGHHDVQNEHRSSEADLTPLVQLVDDLTRRNADLTSAPLETLEDMRDTVTDLRTRLDRVNDQLEARDATINDLIADLRNERQRVDVLEAGRLRMLETTSRENEALESPVRPGTDTTRISTHVEADAPPASAWRRVWHKITGG